MYNLHPHQVIVKQRIQECVRGGSKRVLVFACTGFGKTILSYDIIKNAISKGNSVLFTSHRITLAEQSAEKFADLNPGYLQGDQKNFDDDYLLLVASLQTLINTDIKAPKIAILDEVHYGHEAGMIQSLFTKFPDTIFIGLSATPCDDRGYLLEGWDAIIDDYQTKDVIDLGFLVPFKVFAPMSTDLSSVKMKGDDYDEKSLAEVINKDDINESAVKNYIELCEGRKFIGFAANKAHCESLKAIFDREGIRVEIITANTTPKQRKIILAKYAVNELDGLLSIEILTAGFDDPSVKAIVLFTKTMAWRKFVQMAGRGIRLLGRSFAESVANGKSDCILMDCCGNIEEHGMPDDRKKLIFKKKISRVIDRELGLDTDNEIRQTIVLTEEKQIYLKRIGSLLDLYEGKIYRNEAEFQEDANSYLKKTQFFWWRQNSGKALIKGQWVHFASKTGLPDNTAFYGETSIFFGLELKMPRGYLTDHQKKTLPEMTQRGVLVFICESIYDIYMAINHMEMHIKTDDSGVFISRDIYNLPERQIELRNKLKLPLYNQQ